MKHNLEVYAPEVGDVINWCDQEYIVIENNGDTGLVNPVGETCYIRWFRWHIGKDKSTFVRKATKQDLNALELDIKKPL